MITLQGAQLKNYSFDVAENKIQGDYNIMTNQGRVIAKQGFNGYSEIKVDMSMETKKALAIFNASLSKDINLVLGFVETKEN